MYTSFGVSSTLYVVYYSFPSYVNFSFCFLLVGEGC